MENKEVRSLIYTYNLKMWQIAMKIGISASQFSVWLRTPLSEEKKEKIIAAINELKNTN